ncbi:MAG: FAD-dependent thymidylate synthase [Candidatus Caenarcaniphilales bacterium]|nr:FAD-dependent thymidylate synthase [Candidatus Caenarcaniphilales bacterium]
MTELLEKSTAKIEDLKADLGPLGYIELLDTMGDDLSIVNAARVSYNKTSDEFEARDKKLVKFLAKHKHWTPFEQNSIKFRVKCPIYIARQWMKHRCWVFNEISARYTVFDNTIYTPEAFREQAEKNKQASVEATEELNQAEATKIYENSWKVSLDAYNKLLDLGVCREQARGVLPVGSHTEFITTVNLRNYMHWYNLRAPKDAQWEIQQYAKASIELVKTKFPVAIECFEELVQEEITEAAAKA